MTENYMVDGQMSLSDLDSWFGKMSLEPTPQTEEGTSKPSSRKSSRSSAQILPMFLYLRRDGARQDASWDTEKTDALFPSLGDYTMHSFGVQPSRLMAECMLPGHPNGVNVSHLSQILEERALPKYSLSGKACMGILRRAEKRGKELPKILKTALENQIEEQGYSD